MGDLDLNTQVAILGFILGIVVGGVAQKSHFCTMGAVSDMVFMEDWTRMRSWMVAMAVAMLGSQIMQYTGMVNLYNSIYLGSNFTWASYILGGVLFGFGMTMAGGCGNKTLVRLGAGNLKSFVVLLVMGLFAYMTLRGLTGIARVQLEEATAVTLSQPQGIADYLASWTGVAVETMRLALGIVVALALLVFAFKDEEFRSNGKLVVAGILIGLAIPVAWYITGVVGYDDFEESYISGLNALSFVAPSGESMQYLMTFTGSSINFGIATLGGVIVGSFLMSKIGKEFAVEAFSDGTEMARHLVGAAMMGVGGVMSMGCTFGQGISGLSTLAFGSLLALAGIIFGAMWGLKYLAEGGVMAGLKSVFTGE